MLDFSDAQIEKWEHIYPGVNVRNELAKMEEWIDAKRAERKNWKLFAIRWLSKNHRNLLEAEVKGRAIVMHKDELAHRESRAGMGPMA